MLLKPILPIPLHTYVVREDTYKTIERIGLIIQLRTHYLGMSKALLPAGRAFAQFFGHYAKDVTQYSVLFKAS